MKIENDGGIGFWLGRLLYPGSFSMGADAISNAG